MGHCVPGLALPSGFIDICTEEQKYSSAPACYVTSVQNHQSARTVTECKCMGIKAIVFTALALLTQYPAYFGDSTALTLQPLTNYAFFFFYFTLQLKIFMLDSIFKYSYNLQHFIICEIYFCPLICLVPIF